MNVCTAKLWSTVGCEVVFPSIQDRQEKQFIFRHSHSVFELLDADGSGNISADEFESFGFLFNFQKGAVREIFKEFDVSGDQVSHPSLFDRCSSVGAVSCRNWITRSSRCLQWPASTDRMSCNRTSKAAGLTLPDGVAFSSCKF